jgi:hypothetical protein
MAVISGHCECGNQEKYMIFKVFDILKREVLKAEYVVLGCIIKGSNEDIGFPTIPFRN